MLLPKPLLHLLPVLLATLLSATPAARADDKAAIA